MVAASSFGLMALIAPKVESFTFRVRKAKLWMIKHTEKFRAELDIEPFGFEILER